MSVSFFLYFWTWKLQIEDDLSENLPNSGLIMQDSWGCRQNCISSLLSFCATGSALDYSTTVFPVKNEYPLIYRYTVYAFNRNTVYALYRYMILRFNYNYTVQKPQAIVTGYVDWIWTTRMSRAIYSSLIDSEILIVTVHQSFSMNSIFIHRHWTDVVFSIYLTILLLRVSFLHPASNFRCTVSKG